MLTLINLENYTITWLIYKDGLIVWQSSFFWCRDLGYLDFFLFWTFYLGHLWWQCFGLFYGQLWGHWTLLDTLVKDFQCHMMSAKTWKQSKVRPSTGFTYAHHACQNWRLTICVKCPCMFRWMKSVSILICILVKLQLLVYKVFLYLGYC